MVEILEQNTENIRTFYIYQFKNKINGKIYIGQCTNPEQRKIAHKSRAEKNDGGCPLFYRAIRKYGFDQFEFTILKTVTSQQLADETEKEYIKSLNATDPEIGYNIMAGGGGRAHPLNTDTHKFCTGCETVKLRTEFGTNIHTHDKIQSVCFECFNERQRNKYAALSDKEKAKINAERRENYKENSEPAKEQAKKYHHENKETIAQRKAEYYQENKEKILESHKNYYQENKIELLDKNKKYRENVTNANSQLSKEGIYARTSVKFCIACEIEHPSTDFYTDKTKKDGLANTCKTVHKARMAEKQTEKTREQKDAENAKNRERYRENGGRTREEQNKINAYRKNKYNTNTEFKKQLIKNSSAQYQKNKEEKVAYEKEKRQKNKELNLLLTDAQIYARTPLKKCSICKKMHESTEFYIDRNNKDGLGKIKNSNKYGCIKS